MYVQVKYASLPNFEDREEEFMAESVLLRRRFTTDGTFSKTFPKRIDTCFHLPCLNLHTAAIVLQLRKLNLKEYTSVEEQLSDD